MHATELSSDFCTCRFRCGCDVRYAPASDKVFGRMNKPLIWTGAVLVGFTFWGIVFHAVLQGIAH